MLAAMAMVFVVLFDGKLGLLEGIILLASLLGVLAWTVYTGIREGRNAPGTHDDPLETEFESELALDEIMPKASAAFWLMAGGILLVASSRLLVWGATTIATTLGISDLIIGLTMVAIGTSLPEVAASIASVVKGENDIAIGNVLGSNIFNSLGVIGLPAIINPSIVSSEVLYRDLPVMMASRYCSISFCTVIKGNRPCRANPAFFCCRFILLTLSYLAFRQHRIRMFNV